MAYKQHKGFLPLPGGETRNITTNGTIKPYYEQEEYSNGWSPKGTLGTESVDKKTSSGAGSNTNRSGEKGNYGF